MDEIFSKDKLQIIIPILFGTIYFSAFKNGKQTCDRYFINYFLYLLTSLTVYLYSSNELDFGITGDSIKLLLTTLVIIGLLFEFSKKCVSGKTGYLENVLDMFLNIINLFSNLLNVEN